MTSGIVVEKSRHSVNGRTRSRERPEWSYSSRKLSIHRCAWRGLAGMELEHMVEFREAPVENERVSPDKHRIADYLRPKTLAMLLLGFSSGLPFLLVGNTFGYWLRDEHTSLTAIGFLSWVGIAYSLKFLWAPVLDRVDLPLFKRLGHRRGWIMLSQILVGLALFAMGGTGTKAGLGRLGALALVVAFASSTQDIVIDAWRIESADDGEEQGLLASAYQFSYRLALLATDSVILIVAATVGWRMSYAIYGACMVVGMFATWFAKEPERADAVMEKKSVKRRFGRGAVSLTLLWDRSSLSSAHMAGSRLSCWQQ